MRLQNNSFLILLISILFFVVGLELVYIFFQQRSEKLYTLPVIKEIRKQNIEPEKYLNRYALGYLGTLLSGAITSAEEKNIYDGKISWVDPNPGMLGTINYERAITLIGNNGKSTLLFSAKDQDSTIITDSYGNNISFNSLRVGDRLTITESIDLISDSSASIRKITIIKE